MNATQAVDRTRELAPNANAPRRESEGADLITCAAAGPSIGMVELVRPYHRKAPWLSTGELCL